MQTLYLFGMKFCDDLVLTLRDKPLSFNKDLSFICLFLVTTNDLREAIWSFCSDLICTLMILLQKRWY